LHKIRAMRTKKLHELRPMSLQLLQAWQM
jgi:hypothetical protein